MNNEDRIYIEKQLETAGDIENISDGYHTFKELYEYRMLYNAAFFNELARIKHNPFKVYKSLRHADGEECFGGGWFIVTAQLPTGQISNHYEKKDWDLFKCREVYHSPTWDGHTPKEAAKRLSEFVRNYWRPIVNDPSSLMPAEIERMVRKRKRNYYIISDALLFIIVVSLVCTNDYVLALVGAVILIAGVIFQYITRGSRY